MPNQENSRDAEELQAIRVALHETPTPNLEALTILLDRLQRLTQQGSATIIEQAQPLELHILGAMLAHHASSMRALGQQLKQMAHWLPPEHPEHN